MGMELSGNRYLSYHSRPPTGKPAEAWALCLFGSVGPVFGILCFGPIHLTHQRLFGTPEWVDHLYIASPVMLMLTLVSVSLISLWMTRHLLHPKTALQLAAVLALSLLSLPLYWENYSYYRWRSMRCGGGREILASWGKGTAQSAAMYADEHGGTFPPHLAVLLLRGDIEPKQLVDDDIACYRMPAGLVPADWGKIAVDVDAHSLWNYCGADLKLPLTRLHQRIIVAYTKKIRRRPDIRLIAFADNHVETIENADLAACFAESNAARKKLRLPPFSLDGPVPAIPP